MIGNSIEEMVKTSESELNKRARNVVLTQNSDFLVMLVLGPNKRTDFHLNNTDEFLYQIKGAIKLRLYLDGFIKIVKVNEGEFYKIEAGSWHRPEREAGTIGIVVESSKAAARKDCFCWLCPHCNGIFHESRAEISDIEEDIESILQDFEQRKSLFNCASCGQNE